VEIGRKPGFLAGGTVPAEVLQDGFPHATQKEFRGKKRSAAATDREFNTLNSLPREEPKKAANAYFMPQFRGLFWTNLDAGSAAYASANRVEEISDLSFILGSKGSRRAAGFAGCTSGTFFCIETKPAKEKGRRYQQELAAKDVYEPHMVSQEGDMIQGPVGKKISAKKRKHRDDQEKEIGG